MRIDIPMSQVKQMQEECLDLTRDEAFYLMSTVGAVPKTTSALRTIVSALEAQFIDKPEAIDTDTIKHFFALKAKVKRGTN